MRQRNRTTFPWWVQVPLATSARHANAVNHNILRPGSRLHQLLSQRKRQSAGALLCGEEPCEHNYSELHDGWNVVRPQRVNRASQISSADRIAQYWFCHATEELWKRALRQVFRRTPSFCCQRYSNRNNTTCIWWESKHTKGINRQSRSAW